MSYCSAKRYELTSLIINLTHEIEKEKQNNSPATIIAEKKLRLERLQDLLECYGDCGD
jgi:hypothetical protein